MGSQTKHMKGAAEELRGGVEKGVGTLIGSKKMEVRGQKEQAKGRGRQDAADTAERMKGTLEKAGGAIKKSAGRVTGNEDLIADGRLEQVKGEFKKQVHRKAK